MRGTATLFVFFIAAGTAAARGLREVGPRSRADLERDVDDLRRENERLRRENARLLEGGAGGGRALLFGSHAVDADGDCCECSAGPTTAPSVAPSTNAPSSSNDGSFAGVEECFLDGGSCGSCCGGCTRVDPDDGTLDFRDYGGDKGCVCFESGSSEAGGQYGSYLQMTTGNDCVHITGDQAQYILMGDGDDTIVVEGDYPMAIHGGQGDDTMTFLGFRATHIKGDDGDDVMTLTGNGMEYIYGGGDEDHIIINGDSSNMVYGDYGDDLIEITGTNPGNTAGGAGDDTIIIVGNRAFHVEGESVTITGNQGYSIRGDDVTLDGIGHDYVFADGSCTVNGEAIACAGAIGEGDKYGDGGYTAYAADDDTNPSNDLVDVRPIVSIPPTSAPSAYEHYSDDNGGGDDGDDGDDGATCEDTDYGAVDSDYYACNDYYGYEGYCGTLDTDEFDSTGMCCACGGGNRARLR